MKGTHSAQRLALLIATMIGPAAGIVRAQNQITTLASFNTFTVGTTPQRGLTLAGNTLYGTSGGNLVDDKGNIFSVPITGGTPYNLGAFDTSNGGGPYDGNLILLNNTLYGTTSFGGTYDDGDVFSLSLTNGALNVLTSFNGTNGSAPFAGLTLSGSTLYGTTAYGGTGYTGSTQSGYGTAFSLPIAGGTPTILASFNSTNGQYLTSGLTLSGNTLYGAADRGGAYGNDGTIFSIPTSGGTPTVLASFNGSDGQNPYFSALILSGNTLYGTTAGGGTYGDGTIFSVPTTGGTPTILASFDGADGEEPGGLTLSGDTLYGTTIIGGANGDGEVFSIPITGGMPTVLASFSGADGQNPWGDLTLSGDTLYGTTEEGGADGDGTVFALSLAVPEPGSLSLLGIAGLGLLRRQRRRNGRF